MLMHEIMHISFDRIISQHVSFIDGQFVLSKTLEQENPVAHQMIKQLLTLYTKDADMIIDSMEEGDEKKNAQQLMIDIRNQSSPIQAFKEFIAWSLSYSSLNKALQQRVPNGKELSMPYRLTVIDETQDIKEHGKMGKFAEFLIAVGNKVKALIDRLFSTFKAYTPAELKNANNPKFFDSALASLTWSLQTLSQTKTFVEQVDYAVSGSETSAMEDPTVVSQQTQAKNEKWAMEQIANSEDAIIDQFGTLDSIFEIDPQNKATLKDNIQKTWKAYILSPYVDSTRNLYQAFAFAAKELIPYIKEEIFYTSENPIEEEKRLAQQKRDTILNLYNSPNKQDTRYNLAVPFIVSLAQTNPNLQEILLTKTISKNVFIPKGEHIIDDFIREQGNKFNTWLTDHLNPEAKSNITLKQMLENLDVTSTNMFEQFTSSIPNINKYITATEEAVAKKMRDFIDNIATNSTLKTLFKFGAKTVTDTATAQKQQRKVIRSTNIGVLSVAPAVVQKVIQEIMGPQWKDYDMHELKKMQKTAIEQIRQSI